MIQTDKTIKQSECYWHLDVSLSDLPLFAEEDGKTN